MSIIAIVAVVTGAGLTWYMDTSIRKRANKRQKWIAAILLGMSIVFVSLHKLNIQITMPAELLIQWITPWMKHYITGG